MNKNCQKPTIGERAVMLLFILAFLYCSAWIVYCTVYLIRSL